LGAAQYEVRGQTQRDKYSDIGVVPGMRLFIAINFNTETRERLISLRDELRLHSLSGRFSHDDNLHLTLAFIGECSPKNVDKIRAIMDTVTFDPFEVTVDRLGTFSRGTLWWAGVREDKPLMNLQTEITHKLALRGFETDGRKYNPHITLGREVAGDYLVSMIEPFGETVGTIDLMKSERIEGKLTYTSIYRRGKWKYPIVVEQYNPQWAIEFERLKAYLQTAINGLAVNIHHVGSTSVTNLSAKPILDVDIEIADMVAFSKIKEQLAMLGYRHEGNYGIDGREAFKYDKTAFMEHHLYVCPSYSVELRRHLTFRNYLRGNADAVREYGELKQSLAATCGNDIDAYIDGKTAFVLNCLAKSE
jgi:2'-5' RNA ligase